MTIQTQVDVYEKDLIETVQSLLEQPSVYVLPSRPTKGTAESIPMQIRYDYVVDGYLLINEKEHVFEVIRWRRTTYQNRFMNNIIYSLRDSDGNLLDISSKCAEQIYKNVGKKSSGRLVIDAEKTKVLNPATTFLNKLKSLVDTREH